MAVSHPGAWYSTKQKVCNEPTMSCNAFIPMRVMATLVDYEEGLA